MTTSVNFETSIEADPELPTIKIVREFAAPVERVYRAWTDPELVARWLGPKDTPTEIVEWDARTGGHWRHKAFRDGEEIASFYGSFHELRPNERIVQTFTYEGVPDGVSLETMTFEALGDNHTRVTAVSIVYTMDGRDAMIASGMESGVVEGFLALDALLAE
ncbi:SRPBCC family protein [Amycolatopsis nigrescens]|uniref:SRPBCC family protein n=1 Tax=Amycolatopsis nigrescens TaxID=381445 RepID=UPI0003642847|nr:SRPBCC family protein [Amycolatopsis nigrescens]